VSVLIPSKKIALRWNGALQARLLQAPLEDFLRSHHQKCVLAGPTRVTDNLTSATIYFVEKAIAANVTERGGPLAVSQHPAVGQIACAASLGVASLIREPTCWRIAALVGTARLLAPYAGLDTGAHLAASATRIFSRSLTSFSHDMELLRISHAIAGVVENDDEPLAENAVHLMSQRLSAAPRHSPAEKTYAAALSYDLGGATFNSLTT